MCVCVSEWVRACVLVGVGVCVDGSECVCVGEYRHVCYFVLIFNSFC